MIEARDLHKSFGGVRAVQGVSFIARDGEVTGIIGPNGAGKTTILRMIYTVLSPDRGKTLVDGIDAARDQREVRRRLGVMPDVRGLYPRLSAREHVRYFGELQGLSLPEIERRTAELVDTLAMAEFIDRRAKGFSRGQQMKVALARALVHDPHNVILDEPTNGLDVGTSRSVRELLRRFRSEGRCVLLSSHIMHEVAALADRIIIVSAGRVALAGTPEELRAATGLGELEDVFMAATRATAAQNMAPPALELVAD
jgi:sodium transport system ATP-binding protein